MNRIWLIAPPGSPVVDEAHRRLSEHFGASHVQLGGGGDQWRSGDAVVLFFEAPPAAWADPQRREQLCRELADPSIEKALAADATLIPVLVDGARMPAADQLPPALAALSYKHALPVRSNVQLPRDLGRLVEDLEAQLRRVVGEAFALELWLLPLGIFATALGLAYSDAYFRDVGEWSFAYQTEEELRRASWQLAAAGPGLLGAGMLMITVGLWWRRARRAARQRAEYYRSGSGALPRPVCGLAWGCLIAGAAATGWSWPAAALACALGIWALWSLRGGKLGRSELTLIGLGLAGAAVGVAWTTERSRREAHVKEALAEYEAGRRELFAKRSDAAIERFSAATRHWPPYANAYLRLAQIHRDENRPVEALAAINEAIARYPRVEQGFFSPSVRNAQQAYELRAQLHDAADKADLAQQDRDAGSALTQSLNLFGGIFRFWEAPDRSTYLEDYWGEGIANKK